MFIRFWSVVIAVEMCISPLATQDSGESAIKGTFNVAGEPIRDEIFLQEVGRQILSPKPLSSVGVAQNAVFAGSDEGLFELAGDKLRKVAAVTEPIKNLVT